MFPKTGAAADLSAAAPVRYAEKMCIRDRFSELLNYQDIGFLQEHPLVEMNTIYQNARWKVFAVMLVSACLLYTS